MIPVQKDSDGVGALPKERVAVGNKEPIGVAGQHQRSSRHCDEALVADNGKGEGSVSVVLHFVVAGKQPQAFQLLQGDARLRAFAARVFKQLSVEHDQRRGAREQLRIEGICVIPPALCEDLGRGAGDADAADADCRG